MRNMKANERSEEEREEAEGEWNIISDRCEVKSAKSRQDGVFWGWAELKYGYDRRPTAVAVGGTYGFCG